MQSFTINWAAETLNAPIVGEASGAVSGVSIDTRTIQPGDLFFALTGENSNGHEYIAAAFAKGAVAAVVSEPIADAMGPQIVVADTLRAFGDLAGAYRRQFTIPVVGITGSVGKTSTKEMIAAVLRTRYETLANEKNFNNEIGVPLTLFQLDAHHEVAVIEMGMRGLGEIDRLAEIAAPTIGLITNIGYAHIERLGSQENIAQAKGELFARLPANGVAILPCAGPIAEQLFNYIPEGCRVISLKANHFAMDTQLHVPWEHLQIGDNGNVTFTLCVGNAEEYKVKMQAVGIHHTSNAIGVFGVALALDIALPDAVTALENWNGADNRMAVRHVGKITVLDDCYNAGLESMTSALMTLNKIGKSRIAVLGDMYELGEYTKELHDKVGVYVGATKLRLLVTVGKAAKDFATFTAGLKKYDPEVRTILVHFDSSDEAAAHIHELVKPGDTVLVKGSRAMQMEKIVAVLTGEKDGGHGV